MTAAGSDTHTLCVCVCVLTGQLNTHTQRNVQLPRRNKKTTTELQYWNSERQFFIQRKQQQQQRTWHPESGQLIMYSLSCIVSFCFIRAKYWNCCPNKVVQSGQSQFMVSLKVKLNWSSSGDWFGLTGQNLTFHHNLFSRNAPPSLSLPEGKTNQRAVNWRTCNDSSSQSVVQRGRQFVIE